MSDTESKKKNVPQKLREDWWLFCDNYLSIAELACREMYSQKYFFFEERGKPFGGKRFWIYNLYISMHYNLKHSIEIFLKYFILILDDKIPEFGKNGHDIEEYLKRFQQRHNVEKINAVVKKAFNDKKLSRYSLDYADIETEFHEEWVEHIARLSIKYFKCEDIKEKVKYFTFRDIANDGFRYPKNKMGVDINYSELVHSITKEDIQVVLSDIYELRNAFNSLRFLIETYHDVE